MVHEDGDALFDVIANYVHTTGSKRHEKTGIAFVIYMNQLRAELTEKYRIDKNKTNYYYTKK